MRMGAKFQSFWYGSDLSPIEWLCVSSFVSRGLAFDLYTYDEDLDVPGGVTLRDAGEIYDQDAVFTYQEGPGEGSVAAFANMFRYKLLYERGGWWVDMDVLYTGHPLPREPIFLGRESESDVCNAIMKVKAGNPIVRECLATAEELGADVAWGEAGPTLLTDIIRQQGQMDHTFPADYAYPFSWQDAPKTYLPSETEDLRSDIKRVEAPFLHLWNEGLRRVGIQKDIAPPVGSYLDQVANQLGVDWPSRPVRYSAETVSRIHENYKASQDAKWRLKKILDSRSWKFLKCLRLDFEENNFLKDS
jgi:hypothetical protein